tara:strand:+ start:2461 stop:2619 length:159 start_codon:yes stop_codon:yes gene_type:complete
MTYASTSAVQAFCLLGNEKEYRDEDEDGRDDEDEDEGEMEDEEEDEDGKDGT